MQSCSKEFSYKNNISIQEWVSDKIPQIWESKIWLYKEILQNFAKFEYNIKKTGKQFYKSPLHKL